MQETFDGIGAYLAAYGLNILGAILIFVIGWWLSKLVSAAVGGIMNRAHIDGALVRFARRLCYIGLMAFVVIASLSRLGVPTASVVAVLAAAGLAIGFALQGSLANFAAGVMLLLFKPFREGDFIQAAGEQGTVVDIQIFNTVINSPDNRCIIIPNAKVTGDSIVNYNVNGIRRVEIVVGISYEDDIGMAHRVLMDTITNDARILTEPAPTVAVSELGESRVNFVVRPWVKAVDYWDVYYEMTGRIKNALEQKDITIPYPQMDLHLRTAPAQSSAVTWHSEKEHAH